jgi:hypothetical protein
MFAKVNQAFDALRTRVTQNQNHPATVETFGADGTPENVGRQADGVYYCALAQTRWGTIPGKSKNGECWYPYGGKEHRITSGYVVYEEGLCVSSQNADIEPLGFQTDGVGQLWCALAHSQYGRIPGKADSSSCWYSYGGKEYLTSRFSFVGPPRSGIRGSSGWQSADPIFPATISLESVLPEYRVHLRKICVSPDLMRTSEIYRWIAALRAFQSQVENKEHLYAQIVAKAFSLPSAAEGREFHGRVLVTDDSGADLDSHFFRDVCEFARRATWEAPALNAALEILLSSEDADGLQVSRFVPALLRTTQSAKWAHKSQQRNHKRCEETPDRNVCFDFTAPAIEKHRRAAQRRARRP